MKMNEINRIVTRGDFDGIICVVLLKAVGFKGELVFTEPSEITASLNLKSKKINPESGFFQVYPGDVLANLPYHPNCSMWFDHHISNMPKHSFKGSFELAPSAARVIFNYYSLRCDRFGSEKLKQFENLVYEADRIDSADLEKEDVINPQGAVLLSMTLHPKKKSDSPYWIKLVDLLLLLPFEEILKEPEVTQKCQYYRDQQQDFKANLLKYSKQRSEHSAKGKIVIIDFRQQPDLEYANRFLIYTLYPEANISLMLSNNARGATNASGATTSSDSEYTYIELAKSIFNPTSKANIGKILSKFGGGGHIGAGGCRVLAKQADEVVEKIISEIDNVD